MAVKCYWCGKFTKPEDCEGEEIVAYDRLSSEIVPVCMWCLLGNTRPGSPPPTDISP